VWNLDCQREEHGLRVFENRVLRKIFGVKIDGVTGSGEDYINRSFRIFTAHQIKSGDQIETNEMGGACGMYGRQERCTQGLSGEF
jgi:hypothetical protein